MHEFSGGLRRIPSEISNSKIKVKIFSKSELSVSNASYMTLHSLDAESKQRRNGVVHDKDIFLPLPLVLILSSGCLLFQSVELLGHDCRWPYEHLQSVQPKDSNVEGLLVFY